MLYSTRSKIYLINANTCYKTMKVVLNIKLLRRMREISTGKEIKVSILGIHKFKTCSLDPGTVLRVTNGLVLSQLSKIQPCCTA